MHSVFYYLLCKTQHGARGEWLLCAVCEWITSVNGDYVERILCAII